MSRRMMTRAQRNNVSTGIPGVSRVVKVRTLKDGGEREYLIYSVHTVVNGRRRVKEFPCGPIPVSRATEQTRKAEAIAYRRAWEARVHAEAMGLGRTA